MPKIRGIKPETWTDENFVELTPLARLLFIGLWSYACDNGHVEDKPKQIKMRLLPADDCSAAELLRELDDNGRIHRDGTYITIPTFRDHQRVDRRWFMTCEKPGCEKPEPEHKPKSGNSQRETRGGHDEATTSTRRKPAESSQGPRDDVDVDGDGELMVMGISSSVALAPVDPPRPDVERICNHLADRIAANGTKRPSIGKTWQDAARLMLDRDGRSEDDIHAAIEWCQSDEFWRSNVLSLPKLREQYDRLRLQAQRGNHFKAKGEIDWDAAFERAAARDAAESNDHRGIA